MNELTKEASKQAILERFASMWLGGRGRARKSRQQPQKPLAGHFLDYTVGLEPSGEMFDERERTRIDYSAPIIGVDLDQFKRECEKVDNE